ncbi:MULTISPECIES: DUF892 family protein [Methylobacterium]|uniref:Ferritin-like metal-binding protein YciE n=1 Tax=Methylobacterium goesingense TaxID=243690 RepID=A0ABV2LBH2_9HYPH|nr:MULTISPECIES: DUF892 family protein [Methylobacterium]KQP40367.1 hypothetical protein ASF34_11145 [Methylobacterium sp. Leaf106]TXM77136.1 DUF892 family protein [Methylobacterium sp. WL69]TXN27654.1 DUF892 family protein [Methylobacterium sp. WL19]GJD73904.1 hypothetical protein CFIICLFH_2134 [Methylobacterium goesingense]
MSRETIKTWYIAGLQAYRSASEQGKAAASQAEGQFTDPEFKKLAGEGAALCGRQQQAMIDFLKELDTQPNDFKDRIQAGIAEGTEMSVKAAQDDETRDVAIGFGARAGLTYVATAFQCHVIYAKALGLSKQAEEFERLGQESKALEERYAKAAEAAVGKQAA